MHNSLKKAGLTLAALGTLFTASCTVTPGGSISEDIDYSSTGSDRKAALEIVASEEVQGKVIESRGTSIGPLNQVQVRLGNDVLKAAKAESQAYYQTVTVVEQATNNKNIDRVTFKDLDGDLSKTDLSLEIESLVQFTKAGANTTEKKFEVKGKGDGGDIFRGGGTSADTVLGKAREEALQEFVKQYGAQLATMKGGPSSATPAGKPSKESTMPGSTSAGKPPASTPTTGSGDDKSEDKVEGKEGKKDKRVPPGLQKPKNPNHAKGREKKSY